MPLHRAAGRTLGRRTPPHAPAPAAEDGFDELESIDMDDGPGFSDVAALSKQADELVKGMSSKELPVQWREGSDLEQKEVDAAVASVEATEGPPADESKKERKAREKRERKAAKTEAKELSSPRSPVGSSSGYATPPPPSSPSQTLAGDVALFLSASSGNSRAQYYLC